MRLVAGHGYALSSIEGIKRNFRSSAVLAAGHGRSFVLTLLVALQKFCRVGHSFPPAVEKSTPSGRGLGHQPNFGLALGCPEKLGHPCTWLVADCKSFVTGSAGKVYS